MFDQDQALKEWLAANYTPDNRSDLVGAMQLHSQGDGNFGMGFMQAPDMSQYANFGSLLGMANSLPQQQRQPVAPMQPTQQPQTYLQSLLY